MKFIADPRLFAAFDNPRLGLTVVKGVDNRANIDAFRPDMAALVKQLQDRYAGQTVSQLPHIAAWRAAYRQFGVKAKDYPSSVESLYKRALRGPLPNINPLVDIYNYISLKYMLPAGGEDLDRMQGNVQLTYAGANETPVTVLGKAEPQAPAEGEIIYKDELGAICRRWNWREVARTILTADTKHCILVLETLNPLTDQELAAAQQELGELVGRYCGGQLQQFIIDGANPSASW